jgi:hypothetical protein
VRNAQSKTQGKNFTQGSHFTLNWGLSQFRFITKDVSLEIGPTGYSQWQVQDNHGEDRPRFLNLKKPGSRRGWAN